MATLTDEQFQELLHKKDRRIPTQEFLRERRENTRRRKAQGIPLSEVSLKEWFETEFIPVMGGMASSVTVALDTTGPASPAAVINGGAAFANDDNVTLAVTTSDASTTGYQVKIWGNVDTLANANIQDTEVASSWISLASPHAVKLLTGDGVKTLNARIRDDVYNESAVASDTITLDTTIPVITVQTGPTNAKISKIATKDTASFTWSVDVVYDEFKIKVVAGVNDPHTSGIVIATTNGSTDMSGAVGGYAAATNRTATVKGADLEVASAGDGNKIVKVFAMDDAGNWSA